MPSVFDDSLITNDGLREGDVLYYFPDYENGFYFKEKSIVIENIKVIDQGTFDKIGNFVEIDFPDEFSILDQDDKSIAYGVDDEIKITFTHPSLGKLKANYWINSPDWLSFELPISSKKDSPTVPLKTLGKLVKTKPFSGMSHVITDISDKFVIKNSDNKNMVEFLKPDSEHVGMTIGQGISYEINPDVDLPFEFDPTVFNPADSVIYIYGTPHLVQDSFGRLNCVFSINTFAVYYGFSDDNGASWTTGVVDNGVLNSYHQSCGIVIDSADTCHYFYNRYDPAGPYINVFKRSKTRAGAVSGETTVINFAQYAILSGLCIGPSDVIHVTCYYWGGTYQNYYTNSTQVWPKNMGVCEAATNCGGPVSMVADSSNNVYLVSNIPNGAYPACYANLTWNKRTWGVGWGAGWNVEVGGGGATSYSQKYITIDSTGVCHLVYGYDSGGFINIRYRSLASGGAAWSSSTDISNEAQYNNLECISVDKNDVVWLAWSKTYDAATYQIAYRELYNGIWYPLLSDPPSRYDTTIYQEVCPFLVNNYILANCSSGDSPFIWCSRQVTNYILSGNLPDVIPPIPSTIRHSVLKWPMIGPLQKYPLGEIR